jgi:GDP-4-dehydro-6-deoxy-D-mannose reductase
VKKVLITGIEGFVGCYLADYLHARKYSISGIHFAEPKKKIGKLYYCDIRDYIGVAKIIKKASPYAIFHLAAQSSVSLSEKNIKDTLAINVQGTLNILEAVREANIKPRIVYISSCEVYGRSNRQLTEQSQPSAISFYAISKLCAENICRYYVEHYNFDIVILRPFSHTGPGQGEQFIFPRVVRKIAEIEAGLAKTVLTVGNIEVKRDYTDISDIVRAYHLALTKCSGGEIYNVTSGKPYSIRSGIEFLIKQGKKKIKVKIDKSLVRSNDIPLLTGSPKKFIRATGWQPAVDFFTTLTNLLNYYRIKVRI